MRETKYVVITNEYGDERLYMFPDLETHADFVSRFSHKVWWPVRAGFVGINDGKLYCYGEAVSLRLRSDSQKDCRLLYKQFGTTE